MEPYPRSVPATLAPVVEELELRQPKVVTREMLRSILSRRGVALSAREAAHRLQRHGWLLSLRTRGAWEFAPASRAGPIGSGDRFIELRATLVRRPRLQVAVAYESAVWLHGLARRVPAKDVLAVPRGVKSPQALEGYRITRNWGRLSTVLIDNLPAWRIETLLVLIAAHPTSYRGWPTINDWLDEAVRRADEALILEELDGCPGATWARVGYVLETAGRREIADRIHGLRGSRGAGPFYLGPRKSPGIYNGRWNIRDSLLVRTSPVGVSNSQAGRIPANRDH